MFCTQCGKKNEGTAAYCSQCGAELVAATAKAATETSEQQAPRPEPPQPAELGEGQERFKARNPNYVRPWIRFWARYTDMYFISLVVGFLIGLVSEEWIYEVSEIVLGIIVAATWVVIEPWFLSTWAATPGKALFRIRVTKFDTGQKLNYSESFLRAANVWFRGLGLAIPVVNLVTQFVAYNHLKASGVTTWDKNSNSVTTHSEIGMGRVFLIILMWFGFLVLTFYGYEDVGANPFTATSA